MSKMSVSDVLSLLNVRNVKLDLMVNEKTAKFSAKYVQKKRIYTSLPIFQLFLIKTVIMLSSLPCSVLRNLESVDNHYLQ